MLEPEVTLTPQELGDILGKTVKDLAELQKAQTKILVDLLAFLPRVRRIDDIARNATFCSLIERIVTNTGHRLVYDGKVVHLRANPQSGSFQARIGQDVVKTSQKFLTFELRSALDELISEFDAIEKKSKEAC